VWQIPSFGQVLAMWPGSLQFQHSDFVEHSEAMCLIKQKKQSQKLANQAITLVSKYQIANSLI
jgi:hypothetical protein